MKSILHFASRALVAAAGSRAKYVLRQQANVAKPFQEQYRANAGGWN